MNLTQDDVLEFSAKVGKLSRRNKERFIVSLDLMREMHKLTREMFSSDESFKEWDAVVRPKAAAWHWVWCIAAQATMALYGDITAEVWEGANRMLDTALQEQEEIGAAARAKYNKEST